MNPNRLLIIKLTVMFVLCLAIPCHAQYRNQHQAYRTNGNQQRFQHQRSYRQRSHQVNRRTTQSIQRSTPKQQVRRTSSNPNVNGKSYRLDGGDIVSLIVHGVLGDYSSAPIHWPKDGNDILPSIGYPMPVRDDGTLPLPLIDPVSVRGLTVLQAEDVIEQAYIKAGVLKGKNLVTCNLMRKRTVQVMVVHNKYPRSLPGSTGQSITKVNIPSDNATTLRALAEAGGYFDSTNIHVLRQSPSLPSTNLSGQLSEGDIVEAPLPEPTFFYAGGLLNNGRFEIPTGQSINAAQAIAQSGGGIYGGNGFGPSELVLTRGSQSRTYNVNWLMNNPNALIIRPGDTISVRSTPGDMIGNTAIDLLRFGILRGF